MPFRRARGLAHGLSPRDGSVPSAATWSRYGERRVPGEPDRPPSSSRREASRRVGLRCRGAAPVRDESREREISVVDVARSWWSRPSRRPRAGPGLPGWRKVAGALYHGCGLLIVDLKEPVRQQMVALPAKAISVGYHARAERLC